MEIRQRNTVEVNQTEAKRWFVEKQQIKFIFSPARKDPLGRNENFTYLSRVRPVSGRRHALSRNGGG